MCGSTDEDVKIFADWKDDDRLVSSRRDGLRAKSSQKGMFERSRRLARVADRLEMIHRIDTLFGVGA